jgi:GMP synthase-like glutamine amidotransferase
MLESKVMRNTVLIVKNITHEGPGLLETTLLERGIASVSVNLAAGELFADPRQFGAVVVLGGPQSANDETPAMQLQLRQIEQILHEEIPYLGICLGMQIVVKAGGGKVVKCKEKEIGFNESEDQEYRIELTPSGKEEVLFKGLEESFRVFQLHGETVELASSGMELLATGDGCRNQAVRVGKNAYGLQCHFELTERMLKEWIGMDSDLKRMDRIALLKQFEAFRTEYTVTGLSLFNNFLTIAGFV